MWIAIIEITPNIKAVVAIKVANVIIVILSLFFYFLVILKYTCKVTAIIGN